MGKPQQEVQWRDVILYVYYDETEDVCKEALGKRKLVDAGTRLEIPDIPQEDLTGRERTVRDRLASKYKFRLIDIENY